METPRPVWSRDGKDLFYVGGADLISVDVQTTGELALGARRKLLDLSGYDTGNYGFPHDFDVSADGKRFLLIQAEAGRGR